MCSRNRPRSQLSLDIEAFLNMEDKEDSNFSGFLANCSPFGDASKFPEVLRSTMQMQSSLKIFNSFDYVNLLGGKTSHSSRVQIPLNSEELEEVPLYIFRRSESGSAQNIWQSVYLENPCNQPSQYACVRDGSASTHLEYDPYRVYCDAIVSGCIFEPDWTRSSKLSSMKTECSRSVQGNLTVPRLTITDKELREIANYRKEIRGVNVDEGLYLVEDKEDSSFRVILANCSPFGDATMHMQTVDPPAKREAEAFKEIAGLLSAIDIRVESAHNFPELIALWRHQRPRRYTSIPFNFAFGERKQCEISESTSTQVHHVVGSPPAVRCSNVEMQEIGSHRLERQAVHSRTIDHSTKRQADAFKEVGSLLDAIDGRVMSSLDFPELLALSERRFKLKRHTSLCELKSQHKLASPSEKPASGECLALKDQQETANTQMLSSVRALPAVALEEAKLFGLSRYGELSLGPINLKYSLLDYSTKRQADAFKEVGNLLDTIDGRVMSSLDFPQLLALSERRKQKRHTSLCELKSQHKLASHYEKPARGECLALKDQQETANTQTWPSVRALPAAALEEARLCGLSSYGELNLGLINLKVSLPDYSTKRQSDAFKEVGSLLDAIDGRVMSSLDFPELLALSERRKRIRHTSLCELKSQHKLASHYEKPASGECLTLKEQQETANTQALPSISALPAVALEEAKLCGLNSYGILSEEPARAQALPSISALPTVALEEAKLCGLKSYRDVSSGGSLDLSKSSSGPNVTLSDAEFQEIEIYKQEIRARYAKSAEPLIKKQAEEFAGSKCGSTLLVSHYRFPTVDNIYAQCEETSLLKTISPRSPTGQEGSGKPTVEELGVNSVAPFIHAAKKVETTIEVPNQTLNDDGYVELSSIEPEMREIEAPAQSMAKKAKKGFFSRISHYARKRLRLLNCVR